MGSIIMKIEMKMRNSYIDLEMDTNVVNIKCLSIVMVTCIKQHLSNISSSINEKVKQHSGCVEKKRCL